MRPGYNMPAGAAGWQNNHWSKPGFHPMAYSISVSKPINPASHPHSRERRERSFKGEEQANSSALPVRMKARAVFGVTETQPGRTLFSAMISNRSEEHTSELQSL